jgi:hypothetical protein
MTSGTNATAPATNPGARIRATPNAMERRAAGNFPHQHPTAVNRGCARPVQDASSTTAEPADTPDTHAPLLTGQPITSRVAGP